MSNIRRQSIISSFIVYFGFALGFFNTWLFAREGGFSQTQYGLTGVFIAIANIIFAFANLGMNAYIYKFFPYYNDNLPPHKNDMISFALFTSFIGFLIIMLNGLIFKDLVIRKYGTNSPQLVRYYFWIFPFGFGLTIYSLLEAFAWQLKKSIFTNFLREVQFRAFTTLLIVLVLTGVIKYFTLFIKLFAFTYIGIAGILLTYLVVTNQIHFTFSISRVTKKFFKKIVAMAAFVWGGGLVFSIANVFDTILIAAVLKNGLAFAAIYTLAQNMASLIQAPQRAIISSSIGPLSQAWKNKDFARLNQIYQRSSINQLLFSVGMFVLIWINFTDGVFTFNLQQNYLSARYVFLFIGLMRIIDMGTGLNSQIIATSTYWKFEFFTGIILLSLTLPLNYILTKSMGVPGTAISNLIALTIYNVIRYTFLLKKFNMQPFNAKTVYTILLGVVCYLICHFLFSDYHGFWWIILRSIAFVTLYISGVVLLKISPDVVPVWQTVTKKIGRRK
ncbi:MAG: polysaccharide biosynthesis C-terminal domain-containing protein [Chitinophagaceae bacterium]|nr:polysaccharide biosynthesis C-terminal domain-containing protein [Chitinophagaceae bacterium]